MIEEERSLLNDLYKEGEKEKQISCVSEEEVLSDRVPSSLSSFYCHSLWILEIVASTSWTAHALPAEALPFRIFCVWRVSSVCVCVCVDPCVGFVAGVLVVIVTEIIIKLFYFSLPHFIVFSETLSFFPLSCSLVQGPHGSVSFHVRKCSNTTS